jgi:hypothetical protein
MENRDILELFRVPVTIFLAVGGPPKKKVQSSTFSAQLLKDGKGQIIVCSTCTVCASAAH